MGTNNHKPDVEHDHLLSMKGYAVIIILLGGLMYAGAMGLVKPEVLIEHLDTLSGWVSSLIK